MAIKYIDIVHHSHTDFGFTDHPLKARELQKRYVGEALSAIAETADKRPEEKFYWTAETLLPVYDWWLEASEEQRKELLNAVHSKQFDVLGLPFNITSFLNDDEWNKVLHWIPEDLWKSFHPVAFMQNDVNGFPTAGAMGAVKKGLKYMWIGPNTYNALPPLPTPSAFKWNLPDGNNLFVWLNAGYCDGYFLFNENWRQGPVPFSCDLKYRKPEKGDIWRTDEFSLLTAHKRCLQNLRLMELMPGDHDETTEIVRDGFTQNKIYGGYPYERLLVSVTGQWRVDNDPPFLEIAEFVSKWNNMGLKPELRLTTATQALTDMEKEIGDRLPNKSGEWVDWWANGTASSPVEVAVSRKGKRLLKALMSPLMGALTADESALKEDILYHLSMFDEHTYGSWESISSPYSVSTRMMSAEKNIYSYRGLAGAENLLADRVRRSNNVSEYGIDLLNTTSINASEWIALPINCLRGEYTHVQNTITNEIIPLTYTEGVENFRRPECIEHFSIENVSATFSDKVPNQKVTFWSGILPPFSTTHFNLIKTSEVGYNHMISPLPSRLILTKDNYGWPLSIQFDAGTPTYAGDMGSFLSYQPAGFAPRWILKDIFNTDDAVVRGAKRAELLHETAAQYHNQTQVEETSYTINFTQTFSHPALHFGYRQLTIYKNEARMKLKVKINRRSSMSPEIFYLKFQLPCEAVVPYISNAGNPFRPGVDQLEGSCMDYYAIDGWALYKTQNNCWLWASQDAPIITFEKPNAVARLSHLPNKTQYILSMIFDNTWDTNFAADSHGIMEFNYDLLWNQNIDVEEVDVLVNGLAQEPLVVVKTN